MTRWLSSERVAELQAAARKRGSSRSPAIRQQGAGVSACAAVARLHASESDVLRAVLGTLSLHPKVAWAARINSGAFEVDGRFVKAAFRGCSDILGILKGGRLLAVECKSSTGKLSGDQAAFLDAVNGAGGLGFVARSVDDVMSALAAI